MGHRSWSRYLCFCSSRKLNLSYYRNFLSSKIKGIVSHILNIRVLPPKTTFRIICKKSSFDPRFPYPNDTCVPNLRFPPLKMCSGGVVKVLKNAIFADVSHGEGWSNQANFFFLIYYVNNEGLQGRNFLANENSGY